jgi:hypothetical protein
MLGENQITKINDPIKLIGKLRKTSIKRVILLYRIQSDLSLNIEKLLTSKT